MAQNPVPKLASPNIAVRITACSVSGPFAAPGMSVKADTLARRLVQQLAWTGTAAFSLLLLFSLLRPLEIESWARQQIAEEVRARLKAPHLGDVALAAKAIRMSAQRGKTTRGDATPAGEMERLKSMAESKSVEVSESLLREVRIFSGANATVFLLLALIATWWSRPGMQLLAPATVLGAAPASS